MNEENNELSQPALCEGQVTFDMRFNGSTSRVWGERHMSDITGSSTRRPADHTRREERLIYRRLMNATLQIWSIWWQHLRSRRTHVERKDWDLQPVTLRAAQQQAAWLPASCSILSLTAALRPSAAALRHELWKVKGAFYFLAVCDFSCYHVNFSLIAWRLVVGGWGGVALESLEDCDQLRCVRAVRLGRRDSAPQCEFVYSPNAGAFMLSGGCTVAECIKCTVCDIGGLCIIRCLSHLRRCKHQTSRNSDWLLADHWQEQQIAYATHWVDLNSNHI